MSLYSISFLEEWFENLAKKVHIDVSHEKKFAAINMGYYHCKIFYV